MSSRSDKWPDDINRALVAEAPSPLYRWHKYWTRKPHNVVSEYIEHYSNPGELVLDPFSGSGVTAIEAVRSGRRAVSIDISPIAIDIQRATLTPFDIDALDRAFAEVRDAVKREIEELYSTKCRKCRSLVAGDCFVWISAVPKEVRYHCPQCGDIQDEACNLDSDDLIHLDNLSKTKIPDWYPNTPLQYPGGKPFMKGEGHQDLTTLFTHRNLRALAALNRAITNLSDQRAQWFFRMTFSSMVHLAANLSPVRDARPFAAFWAQHSYWIPPDGYMEMNVWRLFESAYKGNQGFRSAKIASNREIPVAREVISFGRLRKPGDYLLVAEPALLALKAIPSDSIDYVFTDPPYAGSIQFGELSILWLAWLHPAAVTTQALDKLVDHEITINEHQDKDFDLYYSLLYATFQEVFRVLKPGRYMTVTFHNPRTKIRNATIRAATFSGFEYEKIVYQPPAITSYKSLLQPFGSADGDFFFRFRKPQNQAGSAMEEADSATFERIVVETVKQVLAERGEPTPYTHLINYVDPVLARHGFFLNLNPGIDVDDILRKHSGPGREFRRVEQKIQNVTGESWWFQDMDVVYRLDHVPLMERVEATVLRLLKRRHSIRFTDALNAVFTEFPNSLTPDSNNVKDVLEEYAEPAGRSGIWRLKRSVEQDETSHSEMVYLLATMGRKAGHEVWVGKREQADSWLLTRLKDLNSRASLKLNNIDPTQLDRIEMVDVVWYENGKPLALFEVESTTMLTEALVRSSGLPPDIPRFMVIPLERTRLVSRKLGSPLFKDMVEGQWWNFLYFEEVRSLSHTRNPSVQAVLKRTGLRADEDQTRAHRRRRTVKAPQLSFEDLTNA